MAAKTSPDSLLRLAQFLFEVGSLRKIPRAHMQSLYSTDVADNTASHSYRVAMIGYFLAVLEKADTGKVVMMCLMHDVEEARSGDQNWVHKKYVKVFSEEIKNDQLANVPGEHSLKQIVQEYEERESVEARIAKDADNLDQLLLNREYAWSGNKEAERWLEGQHQLKNMYTKSGKKLAKLLHTVRPSEWWDAAYQSTRRT